MKKTGLLLIFGLLCSLSLSAATVSVLVLETGLPPGNGCTPSAEVWESGMMDAFFDAGHIVSNAPCQQIVSAAYGATKGLPMEAGSDFDQARIGGADFFILVLLNYQGDISENPTKEICIRVFQVSSGDLLYETQLTRRAWENIDEEFFFAKQNAGKILPVLVKKG